LKGLVQDAQTPPKYKGTKLYKKQKNKTKGSNFNTNAEPKTTKPEKTHGWHSNQKITTTHHQNVFHVNLNTVLPNLF
jgi:hypothetical protein